MKKIMGLIIMAGATGSAFAQVSETDTLLLKGNVQEVMLIEVLENGTSNAQLNIGSGASNALVATAKETANKTYKVSMSSLKAGKLTNEATGTEIPYTIKYGAAEHTPPTASLVAIKENAAPGTEVESEIRLTFAGLANAPAGDYVDTVTFTIEAQ